MNENYCNYLAIIAFVIALPLFGMFINSKPTPEDLTNCIEATGWSEQRCAWEINR